MHQNLLQKLYSIIGLSSNSKKLFQSWKIIAVSHPNPSISFNF